MPSLGPVLLANLVCVGWGVGVVAQISYSRVNFIYMSCLDFGYSRNSGYSRKNPVLGGGGRPGETCKPANHVCLNL